jgi:SAM-dependent methyltransferase
MADSRWWKDFDAAVAAALPAGARVLDVGCGDGGLVNRRGEFGFDALGVDPAAPARFGNLPSRFYGSAYLTLSPSSWRSTTPSWRP